MNSRDAGSETRTYFIEETAQGTCRLFIDYPHHEPVLVNFLTNMHMRELRGDGGRLPLLESGFSAWELPREQVELLPELMRYYGYREEKDPDEAVWLARRSGL